MKKFPKFFKKPGNEWEDNLWSSSHPRIYPILKFIARGKPVIRVPFVGLIVSDAEIMKSILMNPVFSKVGKGVSSTLWTPITGPTALINMDGPSHMLLRRKLGPIFSPRAISTLSATIMQEPLERMAGQLAAGESIDVVEYVAQIAGSMICGLTGLDPSDKAVSETVDKARELTAQASLKGTLTDSQVEYSRNLLASLTQPVIDAYNRGDTNTVPGRMKELGLSQEEAVGASSAFIIAGTETVISYIPRMVALILESGWLEKLNEDPERMNDVIREGLRLTVPTPVMLRSVTEDTEVSGRKVKKGRRTILMTVLACQNLERGDEFDPDRPIPAAIGQIWFGAGSHFCIGMPLAMEQTTAFLKTLMKSAETGKIIIEARTARTHTFAPSYETLIIRKECK